MSQLSPSSVSAPESNPFAILERLSKDFQIEVGSFFPVVEKRNCVLYVDPTLEVLGERAQPLGERRVEQVANKERGVAEPFKVKRGVVRHLFQGAFCTSLGFLGLTPEKAGDYFQARRVNSETKEEEVVAHLPLVTQAKVLIEAYEKTIFHIHNYIRGGTEEAPHPQDLACIHLSCDLSISFDRGFLGLSIDPEEAIQRLQSVVHQLKNVRKLKIYFRDHRQVVKLDFSQLSKLKRLEVGLDGYFDCFDQEGKPALPESLRELRLQTNPERAKESSPRKFDLRVLPHLQTLYLKPGIFPYFVDTDQKSVRLPQSLKELDIRDYKVRGWGTAYEREYSDLKVNLRGLFHLQSFAMPLSVIESFRDEQDHLALPSSLRALTIQDLEEIRNPKVFRLDLSNLSGLETLCVPLSLVKFLSNGQDHLVLPSSLRVLKLWGSDHDHMPTLDLRRLPNLEAFVFFQERKTYGGGDTITKNVIRIR